MVLSVGVFPHLFSYLMDGMLAASLYWKKQNKKGCVCMEIYLKKKKKKVYECLLVPVTAFDGSVCMHVLIFLIW